MAVRSLNKVMILGNLTRDPELRYTAKGTPVCTFGVATNREWSPSDREEVFEATEFHNVVAWSKLAELCAQLLFKGRKVYIEGRLRTRSWEDAETGKRLYRTEIVARDMIALGAPRGVSAPSGEEVVEEIVEKPISEVEEKVPAKGTQEGKEAVAEEVAEETKEETVSEDSEDKGGKGKKTKSKGKDSEEEKGIPF